MQIGVEISLSLYKNLALINRMIYQFYGTACSFDGRIQKFQFRPVFRIRIRIHMFLGLPDPVPSIIKQK